MKGAASSSPGTDAGSANHQEYDKRAEAGTNLIELMLLVAAVMVMPVAFISVCRRFGYPHWPASEITRRAWENPFDAHKVAL